MPNRSVFNRYATDQNTGGIITQATFTVSTLSGSWVSSGNDALMATSDVGLVEDYSIGGNENYYNNQGNYDFGVTPMLFLSPSNTYRRVSIGNWNIS